MEISVKYLPFISVVLLLLTIIITLCWSLSLKHVTGLPYITEAATTPESCIFGQGLNILWVLTSFIIYIKYKQVKDILNRYNLENKKIWNRTAMQIGLAAAFGLSIVGNFQGTSKFYIHYCGTVLLFGLGAIYQCMQTVLYTNVKKVVGQRKRTSLRIVTSIVSIIAFIIYFTCAIISRHQKEDHIINKFGTDFYYTENYLNWPAEDDGYILHNVSVIFEWICTFCFILYLALFYAEFKKITLYEPDVFVEDKMTTELKTERTNEGFQDS